MHKTAMAVSLVLLLAAPMASADTVQDSISWVHSYEEGMALADYQKRLAAAPDDPNLHYSLAEKYIARSKFEDARTHYNRVIELDADNKLGLADDASYYLTYLCRKEKNYLKAIDGFRAMIKTYPDSELQEGAEVYIPWLYSKAGDSAQALTYYRKFLANFPESEEVEWVKEQIHEIEHPEEEK